MPKPPSFRLWIVLRAAPDLPGQWVGHCLELDVVSQGNSPAHAFAMTIEACAMTIEDDLARGADPFARRAPEEFWTEFGALLGRSIPVPGPNPVDAIEGLTDHIEALLACVELRPADEHADVPMAWAAHEKPGQALQC